jgi:hypothetical protein
LRRDAEKSLDAGRIREAGLMQDLMRSYPEHRPDLA